MATNFKSAQAQHGVETGENRERPGEDLAGVPEEDKDDCKQQYAAERHKFTERAAARDEQSPSSGWQAVYRAMGVDVI